MDLSQMKILKDENQKSLQLCEEKILQWEKFKLDYEMLMQHLETLPDALSYDVTVPFGSNAFTMGKIVHTNEVMVLLGDNWFTEVSAKQAAAIAKRRIKQCLKMLQDLMKEKEQFQNWLNYINDASANENLIEIVERYDDEGEKLWREQHAKNVKAYRQKLAEERKISSGENASSNSDEEFRLRLESLELTEESSEGKSIAESDGSTFDYSDDGSQQSEEQTSKQTRLKLRLTCNNDQKHVSEDETGDEVDISNQSKDFNTNKECDTLDNVKHVRWRDLSKQNIKKITFKHSKNKNKPHIKQNKEPMQREEQPLIQSPSDIYKQFGCFFASSPPKSILKVKHSPTDELNEPFFTEAITPTENDKLRDERVGTAFTGQVYEHSSPIHIAEKQSTRPASHFKNARKIRKR